MVTGSYFPSRWCVDLRVWTAGLEGQEGRGRQNQPNERMRLNPLATRIIRLPHIGRSAGEDIDGLGSQAVSCKRTVACQLFLGDLCRGPSLGLHRLWHTRLLPHNPPETSCCITRALCYAVNLLGTANYLAAALCLVLWSTLASRSHLGNVIDLVPGRRLSTYAGQWLRALLSKRPHRSHFVYPQHLLIFRHILHLQQRTNSWLKERFGNYEDFAPNGSICRLRHLRQHAPGLCGARCLVEGRIRTVAKHFREKDSGAQVTKQATGEWTLPDIPGR